MRDTTDQGATSVAVKDLRLAYGSLTILDHLNLDIGTG